MLHGHRFSASELTWAAYDRLGRGVLGAENFVYGRVPALRSLYRFGPGWLGAAVASVECFVARRQLPARVASLVDGVDVLLHGHIHYGPGHGRIGDVATWRTGSFVSPGHLRTRRPHAALSRRPLRADRLERRELARLQRRSLSRRGDARRRSSGSSNGIAAASRTPATTSTT